MRTLQLREAAGSTASRFEESVVPQGSLHVNVGPGLCSWFSVAESRSESSRGGLLPRGEPVSATFRWGRCSDVGMDWRGFGPEVGGRRGRQPCP